MGSRRKARELAIQFLYGFEINKLDLTQALENFWSINPVKSESREFPEKLIRGTIDNGKKIDELIVQHTINWNLDRIAIIDRSILRLATYELLFCDDIPPIVSINEAVDIAKKFSTTDSGKFVNGILDKLRKVIFKDESKQSENRCEHAPPGEFTGDIG